MKYTAYFIYLRGELVYIGCTGNFAKRRAQHLASRRFRHVSPDALRFEVAGEFETPAEGFAAEIRLIALHKPRLNIARGGQGRPLVPNEEGATEQMQFRVTRPRKAAYEAAALREGLTLSAWIFKQMDRPAEYACDKAANYKPN